MPTVTLVLCRLLCARQPRGGEAGGFSRTPALLKAVTLGGLLNPGGVAQRLRPFPVSLGGPVAVMVAVA